MKHLSVKKKHFFFHIIMTHLQQETVIKTINNLHLNCFSCDLISGHDLVHSNVFLIIHNQRETNQILSTKQENVF